MEDRKRLVRCLVREVVLLRDDRRRATGGVSTIRIGWHSGAWSELRARRPSSGETTGTPEPVLERIRALAQQRPDDRVAAILNAEGARTRQGLTWTYGRVATVRHRHGIPTACPIVPRGAGPRGDGLVSVGTVAAQLGVARSVVGRWCQRGLLAAEHKAALDPWWVRLTAEDLARLDGTLAATGCGRWRLRDAQRELGLCNEELAQRLRKGKLIAYRGWVGEHWEWRVSPADHQQPESRPQPPEVHAESTEVQ